MTPILKLFASKESVAVVSEGLECFGGIGYLENSGMPRILRDTQVNSIWEGTTNLLAVDFVTEIWKNFETSIKALTE